MLRVPKTGIEKKKEKVKINNECILALSTINSPESPDCKLLTRHKRQQKQEETERRKEKKAIIPPTYTSPDGGKLQGT